MLSFILPSPVTFTVKALPVHTHNDRFSLVVENNNTVISSGFKVSTLNMLVCELDVDDVIARLGGAIGDLTGAVLLVLGVDIHFAGSLNGQAQATIAWMQETCQCGDKYKI